ncbi:c-type cytochrome [Frateuria aurantia]
MSISQIFSLRRSRRTVTVAMGLSLMLGLSAAHAQDSTDPGLIAQGQAVATAADCAACHTAQPGHPFAGGLALHSPMGVIYASNITPSSTAGIGGYSEQQFADALRRGVNAQGEHLYPAMPYTAYAGLSDQDIHAMYAYFMHGVKPDDQPSPQTHLAFPFNIRASMIGWNLLYLHGGHPQATPAADGSVARGKYLADTLAHCSTCHTPRNTMMAEDSSHYLGGGVVDGWIAPNITSDPVSGIGGWSTQELVDYLKTGHVPGKGQAGGSMAEAISKSFSHLPDSDLQAIAAYLKTVPAIRNPGDTQPAFAYAGDGKLPALTEREPVLPHGKNGADARRLPDTDDAAQLYTSACASCHQPAGEGTQGQYFPSLSHNRAVGLSSPDNLIQVILQGLDRKGADLAVLMPAFGKDLSDSQVATIVNYVETHFGNPQVQTTAAHVAQLRSGGETPLLMKLMPWLLGLGGLVLLLVLVLLIRLIGRRR